MKGRLAREIRPTLSLAALLGALAVPLMAGGSPPAGQPEAWEPRQFGQEPEQEPEQEPAEGHLQVGNTRFIFDDIYTFEGSVNDLFVWAWLPSLSGTVHDNAFIGGQRVVLDSSTSVGGDLFLFAHIADIEAEVGGDVYCFCGVLTIGPGAVVRGSMFGTGERISIQGTVEGPINFAGGRILVDGTLGDDAILEVGGLEIGPEAQIAGDLRYESPRQGSIDPAAVIGGEVRHIVPAEDEDEEEGTEKAGWFSPWSVLWKAWLYAGSFLAGALLLVLGGETARRPADSLGKQPAQGLGFGFVVAVVIPAAALLAIVLIITLPLGVLAILLYLVALYVARLVTAQCVGGWLLRRLRSGTEPSAYAALALGLLVFYLVVSIPFLGFLIWIASIVAGLGGIFLALRRRAAAPQAVAEATPVA